MAAVSAWFMHKRIAQQRGQGSMLLREFLAELAISLALYLKRPAGRPSEEKLPPAKKQTCMAIPRDVRTDGIEHWPIGKDRRNRCKACGRGMQQLLLLLLVAASTRAGAAEFLEQRARPDALRARGSRADNPNIITSQEKAEEVLKRYGYLQCGSRRRRNRHRGGGRDHDESWAGPRSCSAHELRKAVRLYQRNYSMPETGLLDPATLRVMSESRCGNPDIEAGALPQRSARRRKHERRKARGRGKRQAKPRRVNPPSAGSPRSEPTDLPAGRGATTAVARSSHATQTRRRRWLRDYVHRIETGQADRRACLVHSLVQSRRRNKRSVAPGFRIHIFAKIVVRWLCDELREEPEVRRVRTSWTVMTVELQVLCALHFYGTGSFQGMVASDEHVARDQKTVSVAVRAVSVAIVRRLGVQRGWIHFPETPSERFDAEKGFRLLGRIPGVIGCVDGTMVSIVGPSKNDPTVTKAAYWCRKYFYALNVMVVCDADCRIMCIDPRYPGSVHDSFVWQFSWLRNQLEQGQVPRDGRFLLGDSGYPLEPWLITPVPGNHATSTACGRFNKAHSSISAPQHLPCIERARTGVRLRP
ncbi:matrix metalloproteinase-21-like [Ixodes scapularis]